MKKLHWMLALLLSTNMILVASEREDIAFLDELYKQKRFSIAVTESVKFLKKYPESKHTKNIQDRMQRHIYYKKIMKMQ